MHPMWLLLFLPLSYASFIHDDGQFDEISDVYKTSSPEALRDLKQNLHQMGIGHCISSKRKSPINIDLANVTVVSFPPLIFKDYSTSQNVSESIKHNFTSSIHGFSNWTTKPILSGGPLNEEYHLMEVRWDVIDLDTTVNAYPFHYGHTVNNAQPDFELHFVHTKGGLSIEEAQNVPGGVVIVAVFAIQVTQTIYDDRYYSDASFDLPDKPDVEFEWISPETFFPKEQNVYFTYNGTFSQPPCTGDVTWIILANPTPMTALDLVSYLGSKHRPQHVLPYQYMKKKTSAEVFFNFRNIPSAPVCSKPSNVVSIHLALFAGLLGSAVTGLLCFYLSKKYIKKKIGEEDRLPIVNNH